MFHKVPKIGKRMKWIFAQDRVMLNTDFLKEMYVVHTLKGHHVVAAMTDEDKEIHLKSFGSDIDAHDYLLDIYKQINDIQSFREVHDT